MLCCRHQIGLLDLLEYYKQNGITSKVNNCCDEQNLWQIAVVDFLAAVSETVRCRSGRSLWCNDLHFELILSRLRSFRIMAKKTYEAITATCKECGKEFVITPEELAKPHKR